MTHKIMDNTTKENSTSFIFRAYIWDVNMVFSAVLAFVSIYILTAFFFYLAKTAKSKESLYQMSLERKFRVSSLGVCCLISFLFVVRNLNAIALLWFEKTYVSVSLNEKQLHDANEICKVLPRIGVGFLTSGITFVYLFLWLRQRVFYVHPSISVLNNKVVKTVSSISFYLWFAYFIACTFSYFFVVDYHFEPSGGCLIEKNTGRQYTYIVTSWAAYSVFMQIVLLGLFIYPITKRRMWNDSETKNPHLLRQVQKAVLLTSVCLLSDVASAIASNTLYKPNTNNVFIVYSINLFFNQLVTIACFNYWKKILWPWSIVNKSTVISKDKESQSISSNTAKKTVESNNVA